jgi:hypothetical protein
MKMDTRISWKRQGKRWCKGQKMVQRAIELQEHANSLKTEGKALKKKAKTIQK